jgi:hypothetical protein
VDEDRRLAEPWRFGFERADRVGFRSGEEAGLTLGGDSREEVGEISRKRRGEHPVGFIEDLMERREAETKEEAT